MIFSDLKLFLSGIARDFNKLQSI